MNDLDSVRAALREQPAPEPSRDLLPRILSSRAAGVRLTLPTAIARSAARWRLGALLVAAATLLFWVGTRSPVSREGRGAFDRDLLLGMPFAPLEAIGQEALARVMQPRYPLITALDAGRVHAGKWTYQLQWTTDGAFTSPQGNRTLTIGQGRFDGKPSWIMTETRDLKGATSGAGDTVFVDPGSLRPLRHARSWKQGRSFFVQEFLHDSVSERLHVAGPPSERNFSGNAALPGLKVSPLVVSWSPYWLNALVQALPLERRWRGSVYSVNWISMADRFPAFTPLDLRVTGAERVRVPAGSFDCWKLDVREGPDKFLVWVSKEERWVVMTRHTWSDEAGEWRDEALLAAVAPTPPAP